MAKSGENDPKEKGDAPAAKPAAAPAGGKPQQRPQVEVDDSHIMAAYSNFCRVTGTPEELILDFGLNPQPVGVPTKPLVLTQRIVLNYYTAKRMLHALHLSIQRHEQAFGVLETDIQKRVVGGVPAQAPPADRPS